MKTSRQRVLAFRQRATHLHERLPAARLADAAFAGLQDTAPRAAVLALHARVRDVDPAAWEAPRFVQVWGPRGAIFVVPRADVAVFTLGLLPRDPARLAEVRADAEAVGKALGKRRLRKTDLLAELPGGGLRQLFHASAAGFVTIRWDGADTTVQAADPSVADPERARIELARRFLRSVGPSTPDGYAWWSGVGRGEARETFGKLRGELAPCILEGEERWVLDSDESSLAGAEPVEAVRLLPSGDPYLGAADKAVLVPDPAQRVLLWPRSVWPGAILVHGELAGTWRRRDNIVTLTPWRRLGKQVRAELEDEAARFPLGFPDIRVKWAEP